MRVLVVDADTEFTQQLVKGLGSQGIETIVKDHGRSALESYFEVDAVLLNLMLPDMDGFLVCQYIRAKSQVPIIALSGREDEFDMVLALKMGADDYVVKPCRMRELAARIEAAVRRAQGTAPALLIHQTWHLGPLRIDCYRRQVTVDGREVPLTPKEFDLLALLASEPGRTFSREQIMRKVWGYETAGDTRTLGVHMVSLRRKLDCRARIETIRGVGFRALVVTHS